MLYKYELLLTLQMRFKSREGLFEPGVNNIYTIGYKSLHYICGMIFISIGIQIHLDI